MLRTQRLMSSLAIIEAQQWQRPGEKFKTSGHRQRPPLMPFLQKTEIGSPLLSLTVTAVTVAARVNGKAKGVAMVDVEGAGIVALWSGGQSTLIGALIPVVGVVHSGTGLMMTPVVGELFAT